jgi:2-phosphosulfolactate phosphatase
VAKLITHGETRAEAIVRMKLALESFIIEGIHTTIPFLLELMDDPQYVSGDVDTKFVDRRTAEAEVAKFNGRTIVVIDVLRASSTIIAALAAGARCVVPVETVDRAVRTAAELGRDEVLLAGERGSLPIEGFDMGNSPRQFEPANVTGKTVVMTTTNGTQALLAAAAGERCLVAAFLNADAVMHAVSADEDVVLLCAGRAGRFALEDAACAGLIARRLADSVPVSPTDGARAGIVLAGRLGEAPEGFIHTAAGAEQLHRLDLDADVQFCAMLDSFTHVPVMRDRRITL